MTETALGSNADDPSTKNDATGTNGGVEGQRDGDGGVALREAALRDRLMRALADTENTRQRGERHVAEARLFAVQDFARELLPVADNLRRALESATKTPSNGASSSAALIEGVRATERSLTGVFKKFGVRKMDVLGRPFDPKMHEAILEVEDVSCPAGNVAGILEDGYALHERLLRPARVTVAKAGSNGTSDS